MEFSMKRLIFALGLTLAAAAPAFAGVGVSINIGEPGFFGRIDIGDAPHPQLIASRPVIIEHARPEVVVQPIYLHVPLQESQSWRYYCGRYDACGHPVYFVQDRWYRSVYVPHYHSHREQYERYYHERHDEKNDWHGERHDDHGHGHGHDHDHDNDHDNGHDHHDHDRGDDDRDH
jgi:hypothetical protein